MKLAALSTLFRNTNQVMQIGLAKNGTITSYTAGTLSTLPQKTLNTLGLDEYSSFLYTETESTHGVLHKQVREHLEALAKLTAPEELSTTVSDELRTEILKQLEFYAARDRDIEFAMQKVTELDGLQVLKWV